MDNLDLGQVMVEANYSASDLHALHRYIENLSNDRNRRARLRNEAVRLIEESAAWSRPNLTTLKYKIMEEQNRLLAQDANPPPAPVVTAEWSKDAPEGGAGVYLKPHADGLFAHFHYGAYGAGFLLSEAEALDLSIAVIAMLRERLAKQEDALRTNQIIAGQIGVGNTAQNWYIIERRSLFMISPPPTGERWHSISEPTENVSECIHAFEARWQKYAEQGFDVRPVFVAGVRDVDSVQVYETTDPDAHFLSELKIVSIDRASANTASI